MYFHHNHGAHQDPHSFPTRRSSDLTGNTTSGNTAPARTATSQGPLPADGGSGPTASRAPAPGGDRSARAPHRPRRYGRTAQRVPAGAGDTRPSLMALPGDSNT